MLFASALDLSALQKSKTQLIVAGGRIRIDPQRLLARCNRLREAAPPVVDRAEINVRAGQLWIETERFLESLFRILQLIQLKLSQPQIELRERVIGSELHGVAECFDGIWIFFQICVGDPPSACMPSHRAG